MRDYSARCVASWAMPWPTPIEAQKTIMDRMKVTSSWSCWAVRLAAKRPIRTPGRSLPKAKLCVSFSMNSLDRIEYFTLYVEWPSGLVSSKFS